MKNFTNYLLATLALVLGLAVSACTPEPEPIQKAETKVEVAVAEVMSNGATINVTTQNVKEFAYMQRDTELDATAILTADTKKSIANVEEITTTTITITGCEAGKTYTLFFAFRLADDSIYKEVKRVEFTTTSYGDNVINVVDRMYDGFSVYLQIPEEVKAKGNALRYSTSSMPMYNYAKQMGLINWANISSIDFSHLVSVRELAVPFQAQLRRPCLEQSHYRIKQFTPALSGLR